MSIAKLIDDAAERGAATDQASARLRPQAAAAAARDRRQRPGAGSREIAAPHARRANRDRSHARSRRVAGDGRSEPAHHGGPEPCLERARRHAGRRQAHARDAQRLSRRRLCQHAERGYGRKLRHDRGERHRHRHSSRQSGQGVRSVLHHQGSRQGHRARALHGVRLRQAIRRAHQDLQRGRPRHERQALPAAIDRIAGERNEAQATSTVAGGDETVLVVEDDALVRNYVITQIESLGYTTLEAANAAEALAIIDNARATSTCCSPTSSCRAA